MARVLGVDVSESAIRCTLLKTGLRQMEVLQYAQVDLAEYGGTLADAAPELSATLTSPPDVILVAMPGDRCSLRAIELNARLASRIADVLPAELETSLPYPIEDAVFDSQPVDSDDEMLHLLAAATPRREVASLLASLKSVGMEPREIAAGPIALEGLAPWVAASEDETVLLIDSRRTTTDVCVLVGGRCKFARTLSAGVADAEQHQQQRIASELQRTLANYRAAGGYSPSRAVLSGEMAVLAGAQQWLQGLLQMPVELVRLPEAPGVSERDRALFGRSAALAGRALIRGKHINFRRGEFAPKGTLGTLKNHARLLAACAAAVLLSFFFSVYARYAVLRDERSALEARLATASETIFGEKHTDPSEVRDLIEGRGALADPLPHFGAFAAFEAISTLIPSDITHDTRRLHVEYDDESRVGKLELQGTVTSLSERDKIAGLIEEHECFDDLEKGRTTPGPQNEGLNYQLQAVIRCPNTRADSR